MARTQSADYESQRLKILDSAAEAFAAAGYAACSMSDVARMGGASKARLYHYYESKEAILYDLLDRHIQRLADIVSEVRARARHEGMAPRAELELMISSFLDAYRTARTRHIALLNDVKFLGEALRADIVARERAVTMMLMGAMNWTFTWLKPDGALSYADYATEVSKVMLAGLAGS